MTLHLILSYKYILAYTIYIYNIPPCNRDIMGFPPVAITTFGITQDFDRGTRWTVAALSVRTRHSRNFNHGFVGKSLAPHTNGLSSFSLLKWLYTDVYWLFVNIPDFQTPYGQ